MSVESMSLVLNRSKAVGTDKVVLLGIANHDGDGGSWPSIATLARYANVTERSVQGAIARLVDSGELLVYAQGGGTHRTDPRYRPNRYVIRIGKLSTNPEPGVKPTSPLDGSRGEAQRVSGVKPASPEPSLEPSTSKSSSQLDAVPVDNDDDDEFLETAFQYALAKLVDRAPVKNQRAYRAAVVANERAHHDHREQLRSLRTHFRHVTSERLAELYVGGSTIRPPAPAWSADPNCAICDGDGWWRDFDEPRADLVPCSCRTYPEGMPR